MATVRIINLRLRTIIGIYDWERVEKQDVVINVSFDYDAARASKTDDVKYAVDYKTITKQIIKEVEASRFQLLEKLAARVLEIVFKQPKVKQATVRLDKPGALRFADSVSVELSKKR
jgi:D-erythro-7,8-dihydroneopterin triphosphate epimerase